MGKHTKEDTYKKYIREPLERAADNVEKEDFIQWFFKKIDREPLTSEEKEEVMNAVERKMKRKTPLTSEEIEEEKKWIDLVKRAKETKEAEDRLKRREKFVED